MARKFAQGRYNLKNPQKYIGLKTPLFRSSWEFAFMKFCDESPSIMRWSSETVKIPYRNPLTFPSRFDSVSQLSCQGFPQ